MRKRLLIFLGCVLVFLISFGVGRVMADGVIVNGTEREEVVFPVPDFNGVGEVIDYADELSSINKSLLSLNDVLPGLKGETKRMSTSDRISFLGIVVSAAVGVFTVLFMVMTIRSDRDNIMTQIRAQSELEYLISSVELINGEIRGIIDLLDKTLAGGECRIWFLEEIAKKAEHIVGSDPLAFGEMYQALDDKIMSFNLLLDQHSVVLNNLRVNIEDLKNHYRKYLYRLKENSTEYEENIGVTIDPDKISGYLDNCRFYKKLLDELCISLQKEIFEKLEKLK